MHKIWANCLIAGTMTWDQVKPERLQAVDDELKRRIAAGIISEDDYKRITGKAEIA